MKGKLIGAYLVISLIFGTWGHFFGPYQHRGFFYNLGVGVTWPITIFKSDPELDGSSDQAFALSLNEMSRAYPAQALRINYAVGMVAMQIHAESDESVDGDQIRSMFTPDGKIPESMFSDIWQIHRLKEELKDRLDGMELDDLLDEAEEAKEELLELAEKRPARQKPEQVVSANAALATALLASSNEATSQSGEACYDAKLADFRTEMGEDAPVRYDMIEEWRGECGLPPSE